LTTVTPTPVPSSPPVAPAAPPPPKPPAAAPPAPTPKPPRAGQIDDRGVVRRDSIRALRWSSRGRAKVLGEVDVTDAILVGGTSIGGALTADSLRSEGDLELTGTAEVARSFQTSGTLRARATLHCGEGTLRGRAHLDGALRVDRVLTVVGLLAAPSVQVGGLVLDGVAEIPGAVTADRVQAKFRGPCQIGSLQARTVDLRLRPPNPIEMVLGRELAVTITRIEAESVDLEGVDVRFVRARDITLGRHAHVTELEGNIVHRHASARVGPESRSPRPHGLRR
jgi:cytoskeletal protein CcmA (bactofilin family)